MTHQALNKALVAIVLLIATLTSCKPKVNDFDEFADIDPAGWQYGDVVSFHPSQADSIVTGTLLLNLRHSADYLYRNLWLEVETADSVSRTIDTLNISIADIYGKWLGRGTGADFQLTATISDSVILHPPVSVNVRHIMRVDRLEGIEQIGIKFTEHQK